MTEWTIEAEVAIRLCESWAASVRAKTNCQLFLFGSAIYKGGEQFDSEHSDLDIVCVLPEPNDAFERLEALKILHKHKAALELQMILELKRQTCVEPGVSVVPITSLELQANIHKSGARSFFNKNFYYDLIAKDQTLGLPSAGTRALKDEHRQAIEYVQKIRNEYLSVCANGTGGLKAFVGTDPMPKTLLRVAAQLAPDAMEGEWYDTRLGLELMFSILRDRRTENLVSKTLFDRVSIRRGGRGQENGLSPEDQVLLAEMLFDAHAHTTMEKVVTWEIRISEPTFTIADAEALFARVVRLVPDAKLIGVRSGSVILRVRSSLGGYQVLQDLQRYEVLAKILMVKVAELGRFDDEAASQPQFDGTEREKRLIELVSAWVPQRATSWHEEENNFAEYLRAAIESDQLLQGLLMLRNAPVDGIEVPFDMDFLLSWPNPDGERERIGVEVMRLRSSSTFFQKISQLLTLGRPLILVAIGDIRLLNKLSADISRLALMNANVRVVTVALPE